MPAAALRAVLPALLVLVATLACAPEAPAPTPGPARNVLPGTPGVVVGTPGGVSKPSSVRVAWFTVGGQVAPLWVAQDAGLFTKHNLDVELVFLEGGTAAVQAAVAGEAPIFTSGSQAIVNARLEGAEVVDLAQYVPSLPYVLVANPRIQSGADLMGARTATAPRGTASDAAFRYAVRKLGVDPNNDVTELQLGDQESRFVALQAGSIDATVVDEAFGAEASRQGFPVLADVRDLQFPFVSVGTTDRYVRDQPETVRSFMRAFVEAIHYFKTQPEESKQILRKWMQTDNEQLIDATWDAYAHRYLSSKPYPTLQGTQAMLELAAQTSTKVIVANPLEYINPRFVEDLDKSGFVDNLK
jgi:NitT/TauT family transport system substrate-binding protein